MKNHNTSILLAIVAHSIINAYCQAIGDDGHLPWDETSDDQRASILAGVDMHLANPDTSPEEAHESWLKAKLEQGWQYGETKDVAAKLHPCCLPFDELPIEQQVKDYLFGAAVRAARAALEEVREQAEAEAVEDIGLAASIPAIAGPAALAREGYVTVEYIGKRPAWRDSIYNSGLTFTSGQVRSLPPLLASKFLRHPDVFRRVEAEPVAVVEVAGAGVDDTDELLAKREQEQENQKAEAARLQDIVDQVSRMDSKDALADFAERHFDQKLNKRRSVDNLRQEVVDLVNRFGVA